jgi:predicted amidohydrolase
MPPPADWSSRPIRIAAVQYRQSQVASFDEFAAHVGHHVRVAADYGADFVLFPELFTLQLLSSAPQMLSPVDAIDALTGYDAPLRELLRGLALRYRINIVGGSHPHRGSDGVIRNSCHVALRDGTLHTRDKIHATPSERSFWGIAGGDTADVIATDCGPVGILICYDSEFPELARHLVDQGALLLFVPFCTDTREGYLRVRYSCQARAIENQCYLALAGNVGNQRRVGNFDIQYAQSCALTPCDFPFARDGIAAEATANVEEIVFADLRMDALLEARERGTVQNLRDRRHDLYQARWLGPVPPPADRDG